MGGGVSTILRWRRWAGAWAGMRRRASSATCSAMRLDLAQVHFSFWVFVPEARFGGSRMVQSPSCPLKPLQPVKHLKP